MKTLLACLSLLVFSSPVIAQGIVTGGNSASSSGGGGAPSGPAGGDLSGTYPNPTISAGAVTDSKTSLSTGAIASGQFGDTRVAITTGAVTGTVQIAKGGTGATTAGAALTALGAAASGANSDITSMSALTSVTSAVTFTSSATNNSSGGVLVTKSSVTASAFFGDGSHLTGISAGGEYNTTTKGFSLANTFASSVTFNDGMRFTAGSTITATSVLHISTPGATVPGISLGADNRARYLVGASTQIAYSPLLLFSFAGTSATIANSVSQVLQEYTMPGNVLSKNGDSIYVICQGTGVAGTVTRMLIPSIGGTETNVALAGSSGINRGEARISRIAPSSQTYEGLEHIRTAFNIQNGVLTLDETLPIVVQCVGKSSGATGGDVVLKSMKVIYEPANPAP